MGTGFLLVLGIIIFGLLTLASLVLTIIYLAYSKPGKYAWMGTFFGSMLATIICITLTVNRAVESVKHLGERIEDSFKQGLDSSALNEINQANDLKSKQIEYLKSLETEEAQVDAPAEFYTYLGYADYYRLPIRWPFSIHCSDQLGKGELFNEKDVFKFDENDNGEKSSGIYDIESFAFNKNFLLLKLDSGSKAQKKFIVFDFNKETKQEFKSETEILKASGLLGFKNTTFVSCRDYYDHYNDK